MYTRRLIDLRHILHKYAEVSGQEKKTSDTIISCLNDFSPTEIVTNLGNGFGIAAVFESGKTGPTIMIRAELDALPIKEEEDRPYRSLQPGTSHKCGHDGHMTILCGVAEKLDLLKDKYDGRVILLFQPSEETAAGAKNLMEDINFHKLQPNFIIGFHNIPGFPLGTVLVRKDEFAVASQGLIIRLHGQTSHAGNPEMGKNPLNPLLKIVKSIQKISQLFQAQDPFSFITIIHLNLGEIAFGTSPGEATFMATFRSSNDATMKQMSAKALESISEIISNHDITWEHEWVEIFPALINKGTGLSEIINSAKELKLSLEEMPNPFSWSEDFSYYQQRYPTVFFGIGSGRQQPPLHHKAYDFPDELIKIGMDLCFEILCRCTKQSWEMSG